MHSSLPIVFALILLGIFATGCGEKSKPKIIASSKVTLPVDINFSVDKEDRINQTWTRLEVRINRRVNIEELRLITQRLHAERTGGAPLINMLFYLPNGHISDAIPWARASTPDGEITIYGLIPGKADIFRKLPPPEGQLIGSWLDDGPPGKRLSIVKRDAKLFILREFETGSNEYELREIKAQAGEVMRLRYSDQSNGRNGEYFIIRQDGELEEYDKEGRIFSAERVEYNNPIIR